MSYAYYHRRLAGEPVLPDMNAPQPGFYRSGRDPVAYFYEATEEVDDHEAPPSEPTLICTRGPASRQRRLDELDALELWPWVCTKPVPEEEWRRAYNGGEWDDEPEGLGHNRPPEEDDLDPVKRREKVIKLAAAWLEHPTNKTITTKRQADQAAHYITELRRMAKDTENEEKAEKAPFQNFVKQIKARFDEIRTPLITTADEVRDRVKPYLDKIDKENEAERLKARQLQAERQPGQRAPAEAFAPSTRVGGTGHALSLRSYWTAEITDYITALEAAGTEPEVREAVQTVANRFARNAKGIDANTLPGTKLKEDRR